MRCNLKIWNVIFFFRNKSKERNWSEIQIQRKAAALKIAVEVDNVPTAKAKVLQLVTAERIIYKVTSSTTKVWRLILIWKYILSSIYEALEFKCLSKVELCNTNPFNRNKMWECRGKGFVNECYSSFFIVGKCKNLLTLLLLKIYHATASGEEWWRSELIFSWRVSKFRVTWFYIFKQLYLQVYFHIGFFTLGCVKP